MKNKILLITGGTGSFGNAVLSSFLDSEISEIRIFSRDEKNRKTWEIIFTMTSSSFILGM